MQFTASHFLISCITSHSLCGSGSEKFADRSVNNKIMGQTISVGGEEAWKYGSTRRVRSSGIKCLDHFGIGSSSTKLDPFARRAVYPVPRHGPLLLPQTAHQTRLLFTCPDGNRDGAKSAAARRPLVTMIQSDGTPSRHRDPGIEQPSAASGSAATLQANAENRPPSIVRSVARDKRMRPI